jgi:hypothetical protein
MAEKEPHEKVWRDAVPYDRINAVHLSSGKRVEVTQLRTAPKVNADGQPAFGNKVSDVLKGELSDEDAHGQLYVLRDSIVAVEVP